MMSTTSRRQGMAITSLILGVLSLLCFGIFAGFPAIVLGHVAHRRARRRPEQFAGGGLAIAGFAMGYASLITTAVLAGLFLPALAKAKYKAQSIQCVNNLKQIGLAMRIYSSDHNGRFPFERSTNQVDSPAPVRDVDTEATHSLNALSALLSSPRILICPADPSKYPAGTAVQLGPENISYEIETGPDVRESNPGEVLARCPIHGHELLCDGSVHQTRWR